MSLWYCAEHDFVGDQPCMACRGAVDASMAFDKYADELLQQRRSDGSLGATYRERCCHTVMVPRCGVCRDTGKTVAGTYCACDEGVMLAELN